MGKTLPRFEKTAVRPLECLEEGFRVTGARYWFFVGAAAVTALLGGLAPLQILVSPMTCGMLILLLAEQRGDRPPFEKLFEGFHVFVETLIPWGIRVGLSLLAFAPMFVAYLYMVSVMLSGPQAPGPPPGEFWVAFGLVMALAFVASLVVLVVSSLLLFSEPLIVERKLRGWDAVQTSVAAATANIWGVLGLLLLQALLAFFASFICFVGVFLVLPAIYGSILAAYHRLFPPERELPEGEVLPPVKYAD